MPKYEPGHFKQSTYITDFQKENYDEFKIRMPKGSKEIIKALAKERNISVNNLICDAIEQHYKITLPEFKNSQK
jgi:predicted HicB family RNase H-like nuclease